MANLQRRTSHIAITFQIFSTLLLWFIKGSTCSSYLEVLLPRSTPADQSQTQLHPCNWLCDRSPCLSHVSQQLVFRAAI